MRDERSKRITATPVRFVGCAPAAIGSPIGQTCVTIKFQNKRGDTIDFALSMEDARSLVPSILTSLSDLGDDQAQGVLDTEFFKLVKD